MTDRPTYVLRSGVDTLSLGWYVAPESPAIEGLQKLARQPGPRGSMMIGERVSDYVVGWFPGTHLVFAEGHPAGKGHLAPVDTLTAAQDRIERAIRGYGIQLPIGLSKRSENGERLGGRAGLRRLDLAVDVGFSDPRMGRAALTVASQLDYPRVARSVWYGISGGVETVALRGYGGSKMLARVYDKGVKAKKDGEDHLAAEPGKVIRLEDQRRFQSGRRLDVTQVAPATVHELFAGRFGALGNAERVYLGDRNVLAERLNELIDAGELRPKSAEKLAGYLALAASTKEGSLGPDDRRRRRRQRARLRELGLVLSTIPTEGIRLEMSELFAEALGPEVWGAAQQASDVAV